VNRESQRRYRDKAQTDAAAVAAHAAALLTAAGGGKSLPQVSVCV